MLKSTKAVFVFSVFGLLLASDRLFAEDEQSRYVTAWLEIENGFSLKDSKDYRGAYARFHDAYDRLVQIKRIDPTWEQAMVAARMRDCQYEISVLPDLIKTQPTPAPTNVAPPAQGDQAQPLPPVPNSDAYDELQRRYSALQFMNDRAMVRLDSAIKAFQSLQKQSYTQNSQINDLSSQLANVKKQLQDAQNQKPLVDETQVNALSAENKVLKDQAEQLQAQIKTLTSGGGANALLTQVEGQLKDAQDQLALSQKEKQALDDQNKSLHQQLEESIAKLDTANKKLAQEPALERENLMLRSILQKQLQDEDRRTAAKRLAEEEFQKLRVQSKKLKEQMEIITSPAVALTTEERDLIKQMSMPTLPLDTPTDVPHPDFSVAQLTPSPTPAAAQVAATAITQPPDAQPPTPAVASPSPEAMAQTTPSAGPSPVPSTAPVALDTPAPVPQPTLPPATVADNPTPTPAPLVTTAPMVADNPTPTPVPTQQPATQPDTTTPAPAAVVNATPQPTPDQVAMMTPTQAPVVVETTPTPTPNPEDLQHLPTIPDDMKTLAQEAADLFKMNRFDESAARYDEIISKYPESLYAWSNLGVVRFHQGEYGEARKALLQGIKLCPTDSLCHRNLGIVYYQIRSYEACIDELTQAIAIDPTDALSHYVLGRACYEKGWVEMSEKHVQHSLDLNDQQAEVHMFLALVEAKDPAKIDDAQKHYRKAIDLGSTRNDQLEKLLKM